MSLLFAFRFFRICFKFSVLFPSILFWFARSSCFPRYIWVLLFCGVVPAVPDGAPPFLCSLVFAFPHVAVRPAPSVFLSDSRCFVSLPVLHGLRPSFLHPAPPVALRLGCSSCSLPCCRFSLAIPRLSGCCFSSFLTVFFRIVSPAAPSACCGIFRCGFGSFSDGSALLCCCGLWLSLFYLVRISGSRRDMVSLWDESGCLRPLFFSVRVACLCWYPFYFVSAPFLCLVRIWHSLSVVPGGSNFLGALSSSILVLS